MESTAATAVCTEAVDFQLLLLMMLIVLEEVNNGSGFVAGTKKGLWEL